MIDSYDEKDIPDILHLWNSYAVQENYKELDRQRFCDIFANNPYFSKEHTFVLRGKTLLGFACGCTGDDLPLGDKAGYITCILLSAAAATEANYEALLSALEESFRAKGKQQAEVLFFNPMMLPWYIPGTPKHEHNNAPGVPLNSPLHKILLKNGYVQRAVERAMYLNLSDFSAPSEIAAKKEKAAEDGFYVGLFNPDIHYGAAEMLEAFDNPLWKREVTDCIAKRIPVVIAAKQGKAVGFAGPVIREESGRGYFAGIAVHPDCEGKGLGTLLFFELCSAFKAIGTDYMSLYTGSENPALGIYKKAGFVPVKDFAILRRVF